MALYDATLSQIQRLPVDRRVGVIIRHSERHPILSPDDVYTAKLTENGIQQAQAFGRLLASGRRPGRLFSSPIQRCRDTLAAIKLGATWSAPDVVEHRLGHPFIAPAWDVLPGHWQKDPMPPQVAGLLELVLDRDEEQGVVDIFCTHDTILAVLAGYFMGCLFSYPNYWPDYLEGVFIWRQDDGVHVRWREMEQVIGTWPEPAFHQLRLEL